MDEKSCIKRTKMNKKGHFAYNLGIWLGFLNRRSGVRIPSRTPAPTSRLGFLLRFEHVLCTPQLCCAPPLVGLHAIDSVSIAVGRIPSRTPVPTSRLGFLLRFERVLCTPQLCCAPPLVGLHAIDSVSIAVGRIPSRTPVPTSRLGFLL